METHPRLADIRERLSPDPSHPHAHHYLRLERLALISAIVFMLLFAGTSAAILWRIQTQAEQQAVITAEARARSAGQWLEDQLAQLASLDPHWLIATLDEPRALPRQLIGPGRAWHALRVIGVEGNTLAQVGPAQDLPARLAPPPGRSTLAALPTLPLEGRATWVVPILFPATADGVQLVGFLSQDAIAQRLRQLHPEGAGSLSVIASDGTTLLGHPTPEQRIGQTIDPAAIFAGAADAVTRWETNGAQRVVAYHRLADYPFVIATGLETGDLLGHARNQILTAAAILLTVFLFTCIVVGLLIRQYRSAENARKTLHEAETRLRELATHDSLTVCLNRRAILVEASNELHRYRRTRRPFSLLMIDIDNFKQINDHYGHLVGDSILVGMATLCRDLLRPTDQIGRYGGEEFLVLLPETDAHTAAGVANRLRQAVAGVPFETGKDQVTITLSVGVAVATSDMQSLKPLIQSAETALYAAKDEGRDRVCVGSTARL